MLFHDYLDLFNHRKVLVSPYGSAVQLACGVQHCVMSDCSSSIMDMILCKTRPVGTELLSSAPKALPPPPLLLLGITGQLHWLGWGGGCGVLQSPGVPLSVCRRASLNLQAVVHAEVLGY